MRQKVDRADGVTVEMLIRLQKLATKETGYRRSPKAKTGTPFHVPIAAELRTALPGKGYTDKQMAARRPD
jgi:hypothetical protein